jgi:hypothetical protein
MTVIKKNNFTGATVIFPEKQGTIKYWVKTTADEIEIKIYSNETVEENQTADIVILWDIIKLSELQKKPGFVDQTMWTRISSSVLPVIPDDETPYVYHPQVLHESSLFDVFGETLISKPKSLSNLSSTTVNNLYSIFVPDSSDFSSCIIRLTVDVKHEPGFEVEGPSASSFIDENATLETLFAPISLSSTQSTVTANSSITVTVNSESYIDEVFLESISGILNKVRVKLTNGVGKFTILTTDLEVGDEVRVKAGHRKWTGLATFSKQIS